MQVYLRDKHVPLETDIEPFDMYTLWALKQMGLLIACFKVLDGEKEDWISIFLLDAHRTFSDEMLDSFADTIPPAPKVPSFTAQANN